MNHGRIGNNFFRSELKIYRDPVTSLWRELIQNAVDSGASRIDIVCGIWDKPLAVQNIIVQDNGCGMSQDVIENIYFSLGETTKKGEDSVGGFGRARMLTSFAQDKYELKSLDNHVIGKGFDYELHKIAPFKGTQLSIDVITDGINLYSKLTAYLATCQLPCHIYVNGQLWNKWTYRRKVTRDLTFGTIHANKSKTPQLLVRVNGTTMYTTWISAPAQVIVEINQDISRKVLQSSRDGLTDAYQPELDEFISELNINKRSALKDRRRCKSTTFEGKGTFTATRKVKPKEKTQKDRILAQAGLLSSDNLIDASDATVPTGTLKSNIDMEYVKEHTKLDLFDVVIEDETYNSKVRNKIELYDPRNWDLGDKVCTNVNGEYRRGLVRLKLLLLWKSACEKMIDYLQERVPDAPSSISWGVGWLFSDDDAARWHRHDGVNYLLLNPCDDDGTMKYSLTERADLCSVIALAAHEVTHIVHNQHDEDFAGLQTRLAAVGMENLNETLKYMKGSKDSALESIKA